MSQILDDMWTIFLNYVLSKDTCYKTNPLASRTTKIFEELIGKFLHTIIYVNLWLDL